MSKSTTQNPTFLTPALLATALLALAACTPESAPPPAVKEAPPVQAEAPAEKPAEDLPPPDPARLTGLNPREVQALVGEPSLVRREKNVQVMLFEKPVCVLEVVFYEDTPDDYFRAKNIRARSPLGEAVDTATCLAGILPDGQWRGEQD